MLHKFVIQLFPEFSKGCRRTLETLQINFVLQRQRTEVISMLTNERIQEIQDFV